MAIAASFTALVVAMAPLLGERVNLQAVLADRPWSAAYSSADSLIFWGTRVPRVLCALVTGAALALSGMVFQAVLRNVLAEPYILGISAGAGAGKAFVILALPVAFASSIWVNLAACFVGAILPLLLLQRMALHRRGFSPITLLLAGVMINVILGAAMLLVQAVARPEHARQIQQWWLGGLDIVNYRQLLVIAPLVALAAGAILMKTRALNLLTLDALSAATLGVDVRREVHWHLWCATFLAGAAVAIAGPIGFVGLLVPHVVRRLLGPDHRMLAPLCLVYGGCFLALCDLLGWRGLYYVGKANGSVPELPVGVVTALLGGPLFLVLLMKQSRET